MIHNAHVRNTTPPCLPSHPLIRGVLAGTAASLMLLIAACGSDSSNDSNVSSSPGAPNTQTPPGGTGPQTPGGAGGGLSHQGGDQSGAVAGQHGSGSANPDTGSQPQTQPPATVPPAPVPPISPAGISGDVLATMINQPGTHTPSDHVTPDPHPHAHLGSAMRLWFVDRTIRWTEMPPAGKAVENGSEIRVDQTVDSWADDVLYDRTKNLSYQVYSVNLLRHGIGAIHDMEAHLQLSSPIEGFMARSVATLRRAATAAAGTELLRLNPEGRIRIQDASDLYAPDLRRTIMVDGQKPFVIRKGQAVPMNKVLHQWQGTGSVAQLMVKSGSVPHEAQLCLNVTVPKLDRLSCAIFRVPENWKLGEPLTRQGYLVVDDRSHYPGESGKAYWYAAPETLPQHPPGY